jgi:hypothetical protein
VITGGIPSVRNNAESQKAKANHQEHQENQKTKTGSFVAVRSVFLCALGALGGKAFYSAED